MDWNCYRQRHCRRRRKVQGHIFFILKAQALTSNLQMNILRMLSPLEVVTDNGRTHNIGNKLSEMLSVIFIERM
ncbi:hypothetical protein PR048_015797, partial [Dryococelus australis]